MTDPQILEPIEIAVLKDFFSAKAASIEDEARLFSTVSVSERDFTGAGFFTYFNSCDALKIGGDDETYLWADTGGIINQTMEVGFLVYVDHGRITCIECYTYCEEWPDSIKEFKIRRFKYERMGDHTFLVKADKE